MFEGSHRQDELTPLRVFGELGGHKERLVPAIISGEMLERGGHPPSNLFADIRQAFMSHGAPITPNLQLSASKHIFPPMQLLGSHMPSLQAPGGHIPEVHIAKLHIWQLGSLHEQMLENSHLMIT